MSSSPETKILIIGGGLAGLSLAQGLNRIGIAFHIYERDTSASYRAQGYRIRIQGDGPEALRRLLPSQLWEAFEATCATVFPSMNRFDAKTGEKADWAVGAPKVEGKSWNADRAVLRSVLLSGLEEHISFGKRFERYEISSHGKVVVQFSDGSSDEGTFLVGADGIRSVVRKQLLPNVTLLDTEGRAVYGRTLITSESTTEISSLIGNGITLGGVESEPRMKCFSDGMRFDRAQSSTFTQQLGIELPADYIYWVLVFRKDVVSPEKQRQLLSLTNAQSAQLAIDLAANWHESIQAIFKHQSVDATSTLAFLTSRPGFDAEWTAKPANTRSCVTLIGDCCHASPPVGGVGANAGFMDAADLCDTLSAMVKTTDEHEREELIGAVEKKMLERAKLAIQRSTGGSAHFFGMRPVEELPEATG